MHIRFESIFRIGMYWRITWGIARIALALWLLGYVGHSSGDVLSMLFANELTEDPHDALIGTALSLVAHFPFTVTVFLPTYFAFWGCIDLFLSIQLLKHRLWSFPLGIALMIVFIVLEGFRFLHTHSPVLGAVIGIDILIVGIIWKEFRRLRVPSFDK